jgi:hypothetical protein
VREERRSRTRWASVASFAAAALMLLLSIAGVIHLRRTPADAEVFVARPKEVALV